MKKEFYKIILTGIVSTLVALLQAYLMQLGADSAPAAVPAMAGVNGIMLSFSHALSKRV